MLNSEIDKLSLSVRTTNCLKNAQIFTLNQFLLLTYDEISNMRNMGAKSIKEVIDKQQELTNNPKYAEQFEPKQIISETLVIHKAFPDSIGKEIESVFYLSESGTLKPNIDIKCLNVSVRLKHCMLNTKVTTINEIAMMSYEEFCNIDKMGTKTVNEFVGYLKNNAEIIYKDNSYIESLKLIHKAIVQQIINENAEYNYNFLDIPIKSTLLANRKNLLCVLTDSIDKFINSDNVRRTIVCSSNIKKALATHIVSMFSDPSIIIDLSKIEAEVPEYFKYENTLFEILLQLEKDKIIEHIEDGYRLYLPYLSEWIETLKDSNKQALSLRIQRKTLDECGKVMGLTRERIRQIIFKTKKSKPKLREDCNAYWYQTYDIGPEAMKAILGVELNVYFYYEAVYKKGKKPLDEIILDENISAEIYLDFQRYSNRDSIVLYGELVPIKRELLCRKLAQKICSVNEMHFTEFYEHYKNMLKEHNLDMNEKLLFSTERAFEARLQESVYILMKYGRRMRYYPIGECDVQAMTDELHLEQFNNIEISTLKLFNEYPEVMNEYNIMDEYELHNLLNKTLKIWNPDNKYNVVLTRMPLMIFGEADRAKQTEWLLSQIAPVSQEEFGLFYEMEYGVKALTASANMGPFVSKYYNNGYYDINQKPLTQEEKNYLQNKLTEDFYFVDDIKKIFISKFGSSNIEHLNPRTYKELGFKVFTNYVIKDKYQSAEKYFRFLFTKNDIVDLGEFDSRLIYVQSANQALDNLKANYDILETEHKKYISYSYLLRITDDVTKETLKDFVASALKASNNDEFFTIKSLNNKGFAHAIYKLGFDDWFYAGLLKNSRKIKYIRTSIGIIFGYSDSNITLLDFISYVLSKVKIIDMSDFIEHVYTVYGIRMVKDKLTWIIKNSNHFYDSTTKKIYYNSSDAKIGTF